MMRNSRLVFFLLSGCIAGRVCAGGEYSEGYVAVAGTLRIHYLQSGIVKAQHSLLFIPGWRISASIWSRQLDYFSQHGYRAVAIDSRSQGSSGIVQSRNAPEDRAKDVQEIILGLHLAHLTLVGWSQGAQDVAAYVEQFGTDRLDSLALVDSPVSSGTADVTESPGFVKSILEGIGTYSHDPRAYSEGMMHAIITAPTPAEVFTQLVNESMKTPPDIGVAMLVQDVLTTDRRAALKKFDKPTLVVASGESRLLDAQRQMTASLPRAQLVVIEHAAHAVFFDQPDAFNRKLEDFVSDSDAAPHSAKHAMVSQN
jgi:non-heme chloroperoxidase